MEQKNTIPEIVIPEEDKMAIRYQNTVIKLTSPLVSSTAAQANIKNPRK